MIEERLIWPPKMTKAPGPRDVLQIQVDALRRLRPELAPALTVNRGAESRSDGGPTYRMDLTVDLNGRPIELATIEYAQEEPGYPALVITGDAPHWRFNHAYDPEELVEVLKHELSRDGRLTS